MTRIILRPMTALSIAAPSSTRSDKKKAKSASDRKRLTRDQFVSLPKGKQKKYLEVFPKSSHRRLLEQPAKRKSEEKQTARKTPVKRSQTKPAKQKRLTRQEFDQLSKREQRAYKKEIPDKPFKGKKHFVEKKKNVVQKKKKGQDGETILTGPKSSNWVKNDAKSVKAERDEAKRDLKHAVTKEAVDSLKTVTEKDLRSASNQLRKNRSANIESIQKGLESRPQAVILDQDEIDLATKRAQKELENEDSERTPEELKATKKLLSKMKPGKPEALNAEQVKDLEHVSKAKNIKKEPFWKRDLKTLKGFITGEPLEPEGRSNAMLALGVVARYALIAGGIAVLSMGAAPAALHIAQSLFNQWDAFSAKASAEEDEGSDLIGVAYDAVVDHLATMDCSEFLESLDSTFLEFKSQSSNVVDLRKLFFNTGLVHFISEASAHRIKFACPVESVVTALNNMALSSNMSINDNLYTVGDTQVVVCSDSPNATSVQVELCPKDLVRSWLGI